MYTLEPFNSENSILGKSLRTWNIVISNPQRSFCLHCEPGASEESNYISHALTTRLMRDITQILQLWYKLAIYRLWDGYGHSLRQQRLKYHAFRQIYINGYLKLSHIAFYWPSVTSKWLSSIYKPIYDSSVRKILTARQAETSRVPKCSPIRVERVSLEPVAKVISNLSTQEQS